MTPLVPPSAALACLLALAAPAAAAPAVGSSCAGSDMVGSLMCTDGTWQEMKAAEPAEQAPSDQEAAGAPASTAERPTADPSENSAEVSNPVAEAASARDASPAIASAAVPEAAAASASGAVPSRAGAAPRGARRGGWRAPDKTCSDGTPQCYSQAALAEMGRRIAAKFEDIGVMAQRAFAEAGDADVRPADLKSVFDYLWREQRGVSEARKAFGSRWDAIKDDPNKLKGAFNDLSPTQKAALLAQSEQLHQAMTLDLMPGGVMNPLHDQLTREDQFAEMVMQSLQGQPNMPQGSWPRQDPRNPAAWDYDAENALRTGDADAAAADARKALALDPGNAQALSVLAAASYDRKDMPGAAAAASQALALDPNDARAQTVAALAHDLVDAGAAIPGARADRHDFVDVPASFAQAAPWHRLDLSDENGRRAMAGAREAERALSRGDFSAARAAADQALEADPHSAYAYGLKSFAESRSGDAAAALRDAVAGLALNPADRMARKARAQALLKLGRYPEALLAAEAAVAGDPRSGYARYLLAEARAAAGDANGARAALEEAASLDPRYAPMYQSSLQAAALGDMAFLFPDVKPGALASAAASAPAPRRNARFLKVAGGAAAGGGLLAWLVWQLFGASLAPALKTVFTRRGAGAKPSTSPALEPAARDSSLLRGQYKTIRQIGVGGMGVVYEGTDVSLGRRVAIKRMRDELRLDRRQRERFVAEAKTVAALRHPGVVDIYAILDEGSELALIFEFVTGKTLHELVHARGPLRFPDALRAYRGVAEALEYAHSRGIIHRDLKPSNIMLTDQGEPKVMDFGIARAAKDAMTRYSMTNTVVGTPPYMAPEQEQGMVRKESDVYALAVCLYETLTGQLPFAGQAGGMMMNKINKAYTPASRLAAGLPEGLDDVFDKAFEPDPDKRYRSVAELRAALERLPVSAEA